MLPFATGEEEPVYKRIVVGTDGSETASLAVRRAVGLAESFGAELHVLTSYVTAMAKVEELQQDYAPGETAQHVLDDATATAQESGVSVTTHQGSADPADALLDLAEAIDADLMVVGNRGMRGPKRFFLGSVPNAVAANAPCDVMIVKTV